MDVIKNYSEMLVLFPDTYLESGQRSSMELLCENNKRKAAKKRKKKLHRRFLTGLYLYGSSLTVYGWFVFVNQ